MRSVRALLIAVVLVVSLAARDELPRGEVVTVETSVKSSHTYALYLPRGYGSAKRWPILYCLDARSRGELVANLFRVAAEKHGWILACSNSTVSDEAIDPNTLAIRYLWHDTHQRLSIDDSRIYATGFSGLSRFLWHLPSMGIQVAGMIGVGGGLPWPSLDDDEAIPDGYYGIVGDEDFNWAEMHALDSTLEKKGATHRLAIFDGPHGWPDAISAERAVAWMDLQAIRKGLLDVDSVSIGELLADDVHQVERLIAEDRLAEAADLMEWIERDYRGLIESVRFPPVDAKIAARMRDQRRRLVEEEIAWIANLERPIVTLLHPRSTRAAKAQARRELDFKGWQRKIRGSDVRLAKSASRRLAAAFGQLSFYLPRIFLERGEPERAKMSLDLAAEIRQSHPQLHYQRALVLLAMNEPDRAIDELQAMLALTGRPAIMLKDDPHLKALREHPRFHTLIGGDGQ